MDDPNRGATCIAPPPSGSNAPTDEELESLALGEHLAAIGRIIIVRVATCMVGADSRDVSFDPPARFRVLRTPRSDICHWNDEWLDPYWNVDPVDPINHEGSSWWVFGLSRNTSGEVEPCSDWTWEEAPESEPSDWTMFTKRTEDPKLSWLERELHKLGIPSRRNGRSFHAPILEVPRAKLDAAWNMLTDDLDELPDDDPRFEEPEQN